MPLRSRSAGTAEPALVLAALVLVVAAIAAAAVVSPASLAVPLAQEPPPPTPVPPDGSPSPFPTALATPSDPARRPALGAASAALADLETGQVLALKDGRERRPIASLTKIMTVVLVLERTSPSEAVRVSDLAASQGGSVLGLRSGERIAVRQLLYGLMLQSSNDAAIALAEHVGGSVEGFVAMMNGRAAALGLRDTRFYSPHGLDDRGHSTALDLVRLTRRAYEVPGFAALARTRFRSIPGPSGRGRRVQNRNALLWLYPDAVGVKTGYTSASGFCLVAVAERGTRRLVAVVLGHPEEAFSDGAALLEHGFEAFVPVVVVHEGQPLGRVRLGGRQVVAVAAADLLRLVRRRLVDAVDVDLVPRRSVEGPVGTGARVGRAVVHAGRERLGSVAAVAAPPLFTGGFGPFDRMLRAVADAVLFLTSAFL